MSKIGINQIIYQFQKNWNVGIDSMYPADVNLVLLRHMKSADNKNFLTIDYLDIYYESAYKSQPRVWD